MTYAALVSLLFPVYVGACLAALMLSLPERRALFLAVAYLFVLLTFQFTFGGRGPELGYRIFLWSMLAQGAVGIIGYMSRLRSGYLIACAAILAVALKVAALGTFVMGYPLRDIYFAGMNAIQIVQIGALVILAPAWPLLAGLRRKPHAKRIEPWQSMVDSRVT